MEVGDIGAAYLAKAFDSTKAQPFEDLLGELLRHEKELRHSGLSVVSGPVKSDVGDAGRDLLFDLRDSPRVPARDFTKQRLTWDDPSKSLYSCKTGHTWAAGIRRDLKTAFATKQKGNPPKPPSRAVLEHMSGGGRYVVVTSEQTSKGDKLKSDVVRAFEFWLKHEQLSVPTNLDDRVEFLDANDLAQFLRDHKPPLSKSLKDIRELSAADGFLAWEEWTVELEGEDRRTLPAFEPDEARTQLRELVCQPASDETRIIHVMGPPGVGKTRAVYEALRSEKRTDTIRYSKGATDAERAFRGEWLKQAGPLSIVVDEVRSSDVQVLAPLFTSRAHQEARLIMVGVPDASGVENGGTRVKQLRLPPLARAATQRLVETAFALPAGSDDPRIESVLRLAEDYPLFAVLLSRALVIDGDTLERGDDKSFQWDAARRVLAGPKRNYASLMDWQREADLRGKCLLVVLLTGHLDLEWSELWDLHGSKLAQALREQGHESQIEAAEEACRLRELLRYAGSKRRRYVSPNNLARILLNHFLRPKPDGPELGPSLLKHAPEFRAELHHVARRVDAAPHVRDGLAQAEWTMLLEVTRDEGIEGAKRWLRHDQPAMEATYRLPAVAATTVHELIGMLDPDALEASRGLLVTLRFVLESAMHRRMAWPDFTRLEDALFALAHLDDDSPWTSDAKGTWESLFLVALSATHQPWHLRFGLLQRRLRSPDPLVRLFACSALDGSVGHTEQGLDYSDRDKADGDWERPTHEEFTQAKGQAWRLLIETCSGDDPRVAAKAHTIFARNVRGGVLPQQGLDAEELSALDVSGWALEARRELRDAITDIWRYDEDRLEEPMVTTLRALQQRLDPASFEERLQAQVGSTFPGPWPINHEGRDELTAREDQALARELVSTPSLLETHLDWLCGPKAVRSHEFLRRVAEVDSERRVLGILEATRPRSTPSIASYVIGWAFSDDSVAASAWLRARASTDDFDEVLARALPVLPMSDERLGWLTALVKRGAADPNTFRILGHVDLTAHVSERSLCRFIAAATGSPELAWIAVAQASRLLVSLDAPTEEQFSLALEALRTATRINLSATADVYWEELFTRLLESPHLRATLKAAATVAHDMLDTHNIRLAERALELIIGHGHADTMWSDFASPLVESQAAFALRRTHFVENVTLSLVLDWVGNDEHRAALVAATCGVHGPTLSEVVAALLCRFGAEGRVGGVLLARVFTTPHTTHSIRAFNERQRDNAVRWRQDTRPDIRTWAGTVIEALERRISDDTAQDEFRRRYA